MKLNLKDKNIYYLFSSITYIPYFIPLIIEAKKRNYKNVFILRYNYKDYANPLSEENLKIIYDYSKKYCFKIKLESEIQFKKLNNIIFVVDGDIYGPPKTFKKKEINSSLLKKIDLSKNLILNLTENYNFIPIYNYYIDNVDYCFFGNKSIIETDYSNLKGKYLMETEEYNFNSDKNIFLGNTKYDNNFNKDELILKYNLEKNLKYCLILFPKKAFSIFYNELDLINLYNQLKKLNYKLIVKCRPKDHIDNKFLQGDIYVCSEIYPSETLELMHIVDLCVISSSSAVEETVYCEVPCIDFISDDKPWRNEFLLDKKVYYQVDEWKNIKSDQILCIIEKLEKRDSNYFKILKDKYLFSHNNSAEKYFNFIEDKFIIKNN